MCNLSRRRFLGAAGAGLLLHRFLTSPLSLRARGSQSSPSRPNILVIVTDDQRFDALGCAGNRIVQTPNLDALAADGTFFVNAFVTSSICMASRASIFTGLYESRHGCNFNTADLDPQLWAQSYPVLLRKAGYRTGFIGKFGLAVQPGTDTGTTGRYRRGWHELKNLPVADFDFWAGFAGQGTYFPQGRTGPHLSSLMAEQAIKFLQSQPADRPFCLSISFKAPHAPLTPDPAYQQLYHHQHIPTPRTAQWKYFELLPQCVKDSHAHAAGRGYWQRFYGTAERYQNSMKNYYRLVTGLDAAIGKIRQALKQLRLDHNTVILFTSDNGFLSGEHMLGGKELLYEPSIRVPMIIYDPRVDRRCRGQRRSELVLNIDIAPTVLSLAQIEPPTQMQGRDLSPLFWGRRQSWRDDFFCENRFRLAGSQPYPMCQGVRSRRFKYIRYSDPEPVVEELFDLINDPDERNNLVGDERYRRQLQQMRRRCRQLQQIARGRTNESIESSSVS